MAIGTTVSLTVSTASLDALIARAARVEDVVAMYADLIETEAKRFVPVDTGALRDSIVTQLHGWAAEITAGEGLTYARYVEYGTARAPAQPYLRPAMERHAAAFIRAVSEVFS
jgi:HK97 gp10 family phage protein